MSGRVVEYQPTPETLALGGGWDGMWPNPGDRGVVVGPGEPGWTEVEWRLRGFVKARRVYVRDRDLREVACA